MRRFMKIFFFNIINFIFLFSNENFILMTTLYEEKKPERQDEFLLCLKKNLENQLIEKIIIFFEINKNFNDFKNKIDCIIENYPDKLSMIEINSRPKYSDFFKFANLNYDKRKIVLSNADIYLDSSLSLINKSLLDGLFVALTRWDKIDDDYIIYPDHGCLFIGSQDTWIFSTPIINFYSEIYLGYLCCDQAIAYSAFKSGLNVINPCLSIKTFHVHESGIRTYTNENSYYKILPKIALKPCSIDSFKLYKPSHLVRILKN
jgi:hypothetical protein